MQGIVGLKRYTVELASHHDAWLAYGRETCARLEQACSGVACEIQHVGCTSVPGLHAKPIIDIAIGLESMADLEAARASLLDLGYLYRGIKAGSIGHLFVLESAPDVRTEHIHVVPLGTDQWHSYVDFRDALLNSPRLLRRYSELKLDLCARFAEERERYTAGKAAFIEAVLRAQQ